MQGVFGVEGKPLLKNVMSSIYIEKSISIKADIPLLKLCTANITISRLLAARLFYQ